MNKVNSKNTVIIVLVLALLFLLYKSNKTKIQHQNLKSAFQLERMDLQQDLDEVIKDYTDVIISKKKLSKKISIELEKMKSLRDSIKNLKTINFKIIRAFRGKIASLKRENKKLFIRIDSLNTSNESLQQEKVITAEILRQTNTANNSLTEKNEELEAKIALGSVIKTSPVRAIAMKERSSGKLTSTSRSSRADAFRINFDLLENKLTPSGKKEVYIQIINNDKKVIAPKGNITLNNGNKIKYSDAVEVNYNNSKLSIVSLILVNRDDINKGKYTISVFVDGEYCGNTALSLR